MSIDRPRVLAIIIDIREAVLVDQATGIVWEVEPRDEIVQWACAEHGMAVEGWLVALHTDPELVRLFEAALDEILVDPPDPGPYDEISRESPRGAPDPLPEAFERDARLLGRPVVPVMHEWFAHTAPGP